MTEPLLLGLDEAARCLALSKRTVQGLVYAGDLPSVSIGRSRRIAVADLADYVERLRLDRPTDRNDRQPAQLTVVRRPLSGRQSTG